MRYSSQKSYLTKLYREAFDRDMDWEHPKTFNEKLNWLKVHNQNPLFTTLADKLLAKAFVADRIGEQHVVPNLGSWQNAYDIDFDTLPEQFVLKANHDSLGAIICRDKSKFDPEAACRRLNHSLRQNYYWIYREWPYKNIKPMVLADVFLEDTADKGANTKAALIDYKFMCFNGVPKFMYITIKDSEIFENFYDLDFNPIDIDHGFPRFSPEFVKPVNFEKMVELAGVLATSSESPFIRVDFFNVNGDIYFGEFTFYDWAALRPYANPDTDLRLGLMLHIPCDA